MKIKHFAFTFFAFFATVFPFFGYSQQVETTARASEEPMNAHRKFGLSAGIQNSQAGITLPIFITQKFVLAPSVGLVYAEGVGSDISVGLMPKFYFNTERFAPYFAFRAGAIIHKDEKELRPGQKTSPDVLAGIATGAEYFLIPNFSFGVEGQLNFAFPAENSLRFGNEGGIVASLGTAVTANIYFTRK